MRRVALFLSTVSLVFGATSAWGVDGVLEINQTCAVNTGCFSGDAAGFPVTVSSTGVSVRLTGDLTVPDENTTAIQVSGQNVTFDLNGFAILGPNVCSGTPTTCTLSGNGLGISGTTGTSVLNGTVRGMGGAGIVLGMDTRVVGVHALSNGGAGIVVGVQSLITGSVANGNGYTGLFGDETVMRGNISSGNGHHGIGSFTSTIIGNTVTGNANLGLSANVSTGYGNNQFDNNNGGNGNPQVGGGGREIAPNVCGGDLVCP